MDNHAHVIVELLHIIHHSIAHRQVVVLFYVIQIMVHVPVVILMVVAAVHALLIVHQLDVLARVPVHIQEHYTL